MNTSLRHQLQPVDFDDLVLCPPADSETQAQVDMKILRKLFPANQIITKSYDPDVKPQLKLLSLQKPKTTKERRSPRNREYPLELSRYRFNQWDTLNNYFLSRIEGLLYMKIDNQRSMGAQFLCKPVQYFAGYFQPVQNLCRQQLPQHLFQPHNIYKLVDNIKFMGFHPDIKNSFKQNCLHNEECIRFSSNFQSGNLFAAFRKDCFEYELVMQNDVNSVGNTQWFNFAVEFNIRTTYKFHIINFTKSDSLYHSGMKIATFSYRDHQNRGNGWGRGCTNITYENSGINREATNLSYYKLSFEYTPLYEDDVVQFANCFPYTVSDLQHFLHKKLYKRREFRVALSVIGKSISGFPLHVVKFGETPRVYQNTHFFSRSKKKSIVLMARQHSGQTPGSFVMEGILESLIESREFQVLKKHYTIHIIPMVNPDGVYYGNYRTNLSGNDLNRKWRNPSRTLHPEIYYLRKYLCEINRNNPISLIIDFHGHSRKLNSFFYGNPSNESIFSQNTKIFPYLCSKRNKRISYKQSMFSVSEDKRNTARAVLREIFPSALVYTFQTSFFGFLKQKNSESFPQQFTIDSYKKIGRDILHGCIDYLQIHSRINYEMRDQMLKEISALSKFAVSDDAGSDSEPELESANCNIERGRENLVTPPESTQSRIKSNVNWRQGMKRMTQQIAIQSVESSTQTEEVKAFVNQLGDPYQHRKSEDCLSILRIMPLKSRVIYDETKLVSRTTMSLKGDSQQIRGSLRKSSEDLQKLKKRLADRDKYCQKVEPSSVPIRQKLLCIKNIPVAPQESMKTSHCVQRSIRDHKTMFVRPK